VYSDLSFDRAFHSFQGSDGIHIFNNLVQAPLIRVDDTVPAGAVENNTVADLTGYFVDPTIADLHLTATGAAAVLGGGLAVPSGLGDYDDELRPSPPSVGADECAP
jgi:hypothetical protein